MTQPARPAQGQHNLAHAIGSLKPGQRLEVKIGTRGRYDYIGRRYMMMSLQFQAMLPMYGLTSTERDVWDTMVGHQQIGGIVLLTQADISNRLGIARQHVQTAIKKLTSHKFMWMVKRGVYQIHPQIAFYGSAEEQEASIASCIHQLGELPTIEIPQVSKRPARRSRKPRLKAVQ